MKRFNPALVSAFALCAGFSAFSMTACNNPGPSSAEIDVVNDSSSIDVWVWIDGSLQDLTPAGETHAYLVPAGTHDVQLEEADTGAIIADDTEVLNPGDDVAITVTDSEFDPVVSITNNDISDCVQTGVDGTLVTSYDNTNPSASAFSDVCVGETGYFSVSVGDHVISVVDEVTGDLLDGGSDAQYDPNTLTQFTE